MNTEPSGSPEFNHFLAWAEERKSRRIIETCPGEFSSLDELPWTQIRYFKFGGYTNQDHGWYVHRYQDWGPTDFDHTPLGNSEVSIVAAPYGALPDFDPKEVHIERCPLNWYPGANPYIAVLRDPEPNGEVWKWFTRGLARPYVEFEWLTSLLPENSRYTCIPVSLSNSYDPKLVMVPIRSLMNVRGVREALVLPEMREAK